MNNRTVIMKKVYEFIDSLLETAHEPRLEKNLDNDIELGDLGINSIQFIQLIILIETEYKIEIPDEYLLLYNMNTVSEIASVIEQCQVKK